MIVWKNIWEERHKCFYNVKTPSQHAAWGWQNLKQGSTSEFAAQDVATCKRCPQWAWGSLLHRAAHLRDLGCGLTYPTGCWQSLGAVDNCP